MDLQADSALETMATNRGPPSVPSSSSRASAGTPAAASSSASSASQQSASMSLPTPATLSFQGPPASSLVGATASPASSSPQTPVPPPSQNMKGYPKEITVNPVEEKFLCGHCDLILRSPVQSDCGHRFCKSCTDQMARLPQPVRCKACVKEGVPEEENILDTKSMFDDRAAIREMKKIATKCPNPGCLWRGQFLEYANNHEMNCDKKMMECSLCGVQVLQSRLGHHENNLCPKRTVNCKYCKEEMIAEQLEKHQQSSCANLPIRCDKCSKQVPKNDLPAHKDFECPHRIVECPVSDCNVKLPFDQFPNHFGKSPQASQKHMLYLFTKLEELQRQVAEMELESAAAVGGAADSVAHGAEHSQQRGQAGGDVAGAEGGAVSTLTTEDKQKLKLHEDLMAVLHGEILRIIKQFESLNATLDREMRHTRDSQKRIEKLERGIGIMEGRLQDVVTKFGPAQVDPQEVGTLTESSDGISTWKIENFSQIRREATNGTRAFVCSPAFSTGPCGYKMRLRFFADGDGQAKGDSFSIFIQLLKGPYDDLLVWPFTAKIYFMLVDLKDFKQHKVVSLSALPSEAGFQRPQGASGPAVGMPSFMKLKDFSERLHCYLVKDTMILRVSVALSEDIRQRLDSLNPIQRQSRR